MESAPNLTEGFIEDAIQLIENFKICKNLDFKVFAAKWKEMSFGHVFRGSIMVAQVRETSEEFLRVAKHIMLTGEDLPSQIGGLYLVYGLHQRQPIIGHATLRFTLEDWPAFEKFCAALNDDKYRDARMIIAKMYMENAILFIYSDKDYSIEKGYLKYFRAPNLMDEISFHRQMCTVSMPDTTTVNLFKPGGLIEQAKEAQQAYMMFRQKLFMSPSTFDVATFINKKALGISNFNIGLHGLTDSDVKILPSSSGIAKQRKPGKTVVQQGTSSDRSNQQNTFSGFRKVGAISGPEQEMGSRNLIWHDNTSANVCRRTDITSSEDDEPIASSSDFSKMPVSPRGTINQDTSGSLIWLNDDSGNESWNTSIKTSYENNPEIPYLSKFWDKNGSINKSKKDVVFNSLHEQHDAAGNTYFRPDITSNEKDQQNASFEGFWEIDASVSGISNPNEKYDALETEYLRPDISISEIDQPNASFSGLDKEKTSARDLKGQYGASETEWWRSDILISESDQHNVSFCDFGKEDASATKISDVTGQYVHGASGSEVYPPDISISKSDEHNVSFCDFGKEDASASGISDVTGQYEHGASGTEWCRPDISISESDQHGKDFGKEDASATGISDVTGQYEHGVSGSEVYRPDISISENDQRNTSFGGFWETDKSTSRAKQDGIPSSRNEQYTTSYKECWRPDIPCSEINQQNASFGGSWEIGSSISEIKKEDISTNLRDEYDESSGNGCWRPSISPNGNGKQRAFNSDFFQQGAFGRGVLEKGKTSTPNEQQCISSSGIGEQALRSKAAESKAAQKGKNTPSDMGRRRMLLKMKAFQH